MPDSPVLKRWQTELTNVARKLRRNIETALSYTSDFHKGIKTLSHDDMTDLCDDIETETRRALNSLTVLRGVIKS